MEVQKSRNIPIDSNDKGCSGTTLTFNFLIASEHGYLCRYDAEKHGAPTQPSIDMAEVVLGRYKSMGVCFVSIILGLYGLIFGGNIFVDSASAIAREWGVSEAVIGLTIVVGGTSLPELVSSIIAVSKKKDR